MGAAVYKWCEFKSRRAKSNNLTAQKCNSNTVWFNFQTYIIFSINLVTQVTLRSSGTDIMYGYHLLRYLYNILYFPVTVLWILHYPLQYIINYWVRFLSNYNFKYICTIYTCLDTCRMSISRFSLHNKVTLRLLKLHFYGAEVVEWSRALDIRLSDWCCSVSMVWVQIPSREEHKFDSSKIKFQHCLV
jgi:hypothetical protein